MPRLVQLYIRNVAIGFVVAAIFVAGLLWFDVLNLWHLVTHSDVGILAVFLLWFMNGIVFAGVQFGWAIMQLPREDEAGPRGGTAIRDYVPVPVRVDEARRTRH